MKNGKDPNSCIRLSRDEHQIFRCKSHIQEVSSSLPDMAQMLALAGNEVRLKILLLLQEEQKLCVCDLSEILEMKIPAISQHLRKMKDAKMVFTEREGTVIYYYLNPEKLPLLKTIFGRMSELSTLAIV